jgi:hypothetical protein
MPTKTTTLAYSFMLLCCTLCLSAIAQQKNRLEFRHAGLGVLNKKYFLNDVKTSNNDVGQLLEKENKEAYDMFKSARASNLIGAVIYIPSSGFFIYGLFSLFLTDFDRGSEWMLGGLAGMTGGVILRISANRKFKKAADIYNQANPSTAKTQLSVGLTRSGRVGLTVSF